MNKKIFVVKLQVDETIWRSVAYCATREIAERELEKHRDWYCTNPPKPDENHIQEVDLIE